MYHPLAHPQWPLTIATERLILRPHQPEDYDVWLAGYTGNDRSLALVNRIGLHYECLRRGFYYENAQWVDHQIYVGLPRDFGLAEQPPNSGHSWGAGG
jgi:hypothetical protein